MRWIPLALLAGILLLGCIPQIRAGWGETVEVRVLDGHYRPVPNATANITWEISKSRGMATTKNLLTGANGRATFMLENIEYLNEDTNYVYTVRAQYGKAGGSAQFNHIIGEKPRTIDLPVYGVTFRAVDGKGIPLQGMKLYIEDWPTLTVPASGFLTMPIDAGEHTLTASIGSLSKEIPFSVTDDTLVNISANFYDLSVRVLDDAGNPVSTEVNVGDMKQTSDADGYAKFVNLSDPDPLLAVYYGRYKKSRTLNLSVDTEAVVVFDSHPPQIRNIRANWNGQILRIQAVIQDNGEYASGLRDNNASIDLYYIDKNSVQKKVQMYAIGYNLYEGAIPLDSSVPTVKYIVQATDADGNSISSSDTFAVPTGDEGADASQLNPPVGPGNAGGLNLALIIAIVLGVGILAAIAYKYYKNKKAPTEEAQEGQYVISPSQEGAPGSANPGGAPPPAMPAAEKKPEAKPPPLPPGTPPNKG